MPSNGLLSFFYDAVSQSAWGFNPSDRGSWAVIYTSPYAKLDPRPFPPDLADEGRFRPLGIAAVSEVSFPAAESYDVEKLGIETPWSTYGRVLGDREGPLNRLLGNPDPVQGDMQRECQLASNGIYCGDGGYLTRPEAQMLMAGAAQWRLLLQVDSFEETTGMMWGDLGRLYFWVTEADLRSHQWSNAWMVLQCG